MDKTMNMMHKYISGGLFLLFFVFMTPLAFTQKSDNNLIPDTGIETVLPPLSVLIDSAIANDEYVKFRDLQSTVNTCKLNNSKVDWSRYLGIQANYGYGNLYNYSTSASGAVEPAAVATTRSEVKYSGQVFLNLPLIAVINRKNLVRLAKAEIEQSKQMSMVQRDEKRQSVIRQYNEVLLQQRLLRIKSKYLETTKISFQIVEKEFLNGVIPITEYTRLSESVSRAESEFETVRMNFLTSFMILEEIVGMKLKQNNPNQTKNEGN